MVKYCSKCGTPADDNDMFCPKCGSTHKPSITASDNQLKGHDYLHQPKSTGSSPSYSVNDIAAIRKIMLFAIVGVLAEILGMIIPLVFGFGSIFTGNVFSSPSNADNTMIAIVIIAIVGMILGILSFIWIVSAFELLSRENRKRFSIPLKLTWGLPVGLILFIAGFVVLLGGFVGFLSGFSSPNNYYPYQYPHGLPAFLPQLSNIIGIYTAAVSIFITALIAFYVGIIGIILGLWEVGNRYDSAIIKIGGIVLAIPYVAVIGPVLILVGASDVGRKMQRTVTKTEFESQKDDLLHNHLKEEITLEEKLTKLKSLYDSGSLSEIEYNEQKKKLLSEL